MSNKLTNFLATAAHRTAVLKQGTIAGRSPMPGSSSIITNLNKKVLPPKGKNGATV